MTNVATPTTRPDGDAASSTWVEQAALGIALLPIVVAVGRALVSGWAPVFDAGYFAVRSRDVLTSHHPFVGAWSSGSLELERPVRNLGPLQLDLLAPFTKLDPHWGTALGVGLVAAASVVVVWWVARRFLGPVGVVGAMVATVVTEIAIGSESFIDPRQQLYLLLPWWALLWLVWGLAAGEHRVVPPLVVVASLIVQTHFTMVIQTVLLVAGGAIAFAVIGRQLRRDDGLPRSLLIGLGLAVVCWAQPLWDQVGGDGNLGAVLSQSGASAGPGVAEGARLMAGALSGPGFWFPSSMGSFDLPADAAGAVTASATLGVWVLLLAAAGVVAARSGRPPIVALIGVGAAALLAALVAVARIPLSAFGPTPQNYFWLWPTGVFAATAVVAGFLAPVSPARRSAAVPAGLLAACAVLAVGAVRPVDNFGPVGSARTAGGRVAGPLLGQLAVSLDRLDVRGPLVVDDRSSFGGYFSYLFLTELQRAGIEFTFAPGDLSVLRFDRCERGDATARIVLADGVGPDDAEPDGVVLARADALGDDGRAELAAARRRFAGWLADGTIAVDVGGVEFLAGGPIRGLRDTLASSGARAPGLAAELSPWRAWGVVDVPDELADEFDDLVDLETRAVKESVVIALADPVPGAEPEGCPS